MDGILTTGLATESGEFSKSLTISGIQVTTGDLYWQRSPGYLKNIYYDAGTVRVHNTTLDGEVVKIHTHPVWADNTAQVNLSALTNLIGPPGGAASLSLSAGAPGSVEEGILLNTSADCFISGQNFGVGTNLPSARLHVTGGDGRMLAPSGDFSKSLTISGQSVVTGDSLSVGSADYGLLVKKSGESQLLNLQDSPPVGQTEFFITPPNDPGVTPPQIILSKSAQYGNRVGASSYDAILGGSRHLMTGSLDPVFGGDLAGNSILGGRSHKIIADDNFVHTQSVSYYNSILGGWTNEIWNSKYSTVLGGAGSRVADSEHSLAVGMGILITGSNFSLGMGNTISNSTADYSFTFSDTLVNTYGETRTALFDLANGIKITGGGQLTAKIGDFSQSVTADAGAFTSALTASGIPVTLGVGLEDGEVVYYSGSRFRGDKSRLSITDVGVGVNAPNPAYTLEVGGDMNIQGTLYTGGSIIDVTSEQLNTSGALIYLNSGEVGAGVTTDLAGLLVDRGTLSSGYMLFTESYKGWSPSHNFVVTGGINLGIGTTAPTSALHMTSGKLTALTGEFSDTLTISGVPVSTGRGGKWLTGAALGDIYYSGGDVGIGTDDPEARLHVTGGDGRLLASSGAFTESLTISGVPVTTGDMYWKKNGDDLYYNEGGISNRRWGFGTSSPRYGIDFTIQGDAEKGNIFISSNTSELGVVSDDDYGNLVIGGDVLRLGRSGSQEIWGNTLVGGERNTMTGHGPGSYLLEFCTILGGEYNTIKNSAYSTILGGAMSRMSGASNSMILGGESAMTDFTEDRSLLLRFDNTTYVSGSKLQVTGGAYGGGEIVAEQKVSAPTGFFNDEATVGTGNGIALIANDAGNVGIGWSGTPTEPIAAQLHVSGSTMISGHSELTLDYDRLPKSNPSIKGRVWIDVGAGTLMISSGVAGPSATSIQWFEVDGPSLKIRNSANSDTTNLYQFWTADGSDAYKPSLPGDTTTVDIQFFELNGNGDVQPRLNP